MFLTVLLESWTPFKQMFSLESLKEGAFRIRKVFAAIILQ